MEQQIRSPMFLFSKSVRCFSPVNTAFSATIIATPDAEGFIRSAGSRKGAEASRTEHFGKNSLNETDDAPMGIVSRGPLRRQGREVLVVSSAR